MRSERISLRGGGATREEALESIDKQLSQWDAGAYWTYESLSVRPDVFGADGSVRLWRVEVEFERQDS